MGLDPIPHFELQALASTGTLPALIKGHCGLRVDALKLENALQRAWPALRALGVDDGEALLGRLSRAEPAVWGAFLPFLTVNETYFMREPLQLAGFAETALPMLRDQAAWRGPDGLRLLSAGCSTGEEAYSLAILLAGARARAQVLGIDIDPLALATAEGARYGSHSFRGVAPTWRLAHFEPDGEAWRVKDAYRQGVAFRRTNLLRLAHELPTACFDAIACRNVLIYFERAEQLAVIRELKARLLPGGFLLLGHAELFFDADLGLELVSTENATMYRRPLEAA